MIFLVFKYVCLQQQEGRVQHALRNAKGLVHLAREDKEKCWMQESF